MIVLFLLMQLSFEGGSFLTGESRIYYDNWSDEYYYDSNLKKDSLPSQCYLAISYSFNPRSGDVYQPSLITRQFYFADSLKDLFRIIQDRPNIVQIFKLQAIPFIKEHSVEKKEHKKIERINRYRYKEK